MPLPFEQQPRESAKAFAAFSLYLSLGAERSTAEVAKKLAKSAHLVRRWSAKFGWTDAWPRTRRIWPSSSVEPSKPRLAASGSLGKAGTGFARNGMGDA